MADSGLRVKIDTPTRNLLPGRGFYQREEDQLIVQVGAFSGKRQFFSSIESDKVSLDMDPHGRLIGIDVRVPRRLWRIGNALPPTIAEPADIRWLDFRERMPEPECIANEFKSNLLLKLSDLSNGLWYISAGNVFVQVDRHQQVQGILITDIVNDMAGQALGHFRKVVNKELGNVAPKVTDDDS